MDIEHREGRTVLGAETSVLLAVLTETVVLRGC